MANVQIKRYSGSAWVDINPKTKSDLVDDTSQTNKFVSVVEKTWLGKAPNIIGLSVGSGGQSNLVEINASTVVGSIFKGALFESGDSSSDGIQMFIDGVGQGATARVRQTGRNLELGSNLSPNLKTIIHNPQTTNGYTPSTGNDIVDKKYLDTFEIGVKPNGVIKVRSTGNIILNDVVTTLDNYTLVNNDKVLLVAQTTSTQNGIYTWNSTTKKLTKDADGTSGNESSSLVSVANGNTGAGERWFCINYSNGLWVQFDSQIDIKAGTGITVSGNEIRVTPLGITSSLLGANAVIQGKVSPDVLSTGLMIDGDSKIALMDGGVPGGKLMFEPSGGLGYTELTGRLKIKDTGVQTAHLQDGAVRGAKIALYDGGGLETGAIGPDPFNPLPGYQELKIASGGVVNDMIADSTISLLSKTVAFKSRDDYSWNTLTPAYNADTDTPGSNTNIVQHIEDLTTAIKLLRGTPAYKTSNTQTISDLYETKNRTFIGSTAPTGMVAGDIWYDGV